MIAADRRAVPADELGRGVDDDVGAMFERAAEIRGGEGVVDHQRHAGLVGDLGDGGDVEHADLRVADRLAVEHPRPRRDRPAEVLRIGRIDEDDVDAPAPQRDVELGVRPAVEGARGDDLIAGTEQRRQRDVLRGLSRRGGQTADALLERGDPLLEGGGGRVHDPRVDVAEPLQREELGGVVGVLEDVGRRLIDRHRPRAGDRVGPLPGMDGQGVESEDPLVVVSAGTGAVLVDPSVRLTHCSCLRPHPGRDVGR